MKHLTEEDVRRLLPVKDCIEQLRVAFKDYAAGKASNQPRRRLHLESGTVLHSLAGAWRNYLGTKVYTTHPKHGAWFTFLLYDASTAKPLAQFEANWLGQIRTGAASGLAADILAPNRPVSVACIGSGFQAQSQLEAIQAVRQFTEVRVWSRSSEKRQQFAKGMTAHLNVPAIAAASSEEATEGADIVVTATWARDPVVQASAITPGALVIAMGSNNPQRRELPAELVRESYLVADDKEACRIEAGDFLLSLDETGWSQMAELKNVVADPAQANVRGQRTTVFKSVGLGLEDVAAGAFVYERSGEAYS